MTKYLLFAFSDCKDPKKEKEFNDWYDNMHMPDMLQVPGFIKATRWVSADKKENEIRKYLALYEMETDDLDDFNAKMRERGMWTFKQGRFSDLPAFDPDNVPRIYKRISAVKRPKSAKKPTAKTNKKTEKYLLATFSDCNDPKREKEYIDWYDKMHMPDMLEIPGFTKASLWISADKKENEIRKYLAMYDLESDDLVEFNKKMRERGMWTVKAGGFTDLRIADPDNVPRIYKQITAEKKPKSAKKTAAKPAAKTAPKGAAKKASAKVSAKKPAKKK